MIGTADTNAQRCLEHLARAADALRRDGSTALYRQVEQAMDELVGFKLLTLLRLQGSQLQRMHTSDLASYPVGGHKDIAHDRWLTHMLREGEPIISANAQAVREHFFDHTTIFALGCESALNLPVVGPRGTLGSLNLLHQSDWFTPQHVLLARPFAHLLALAWG